ncbi:hypothetical protein QJS10_CPB14g01342 [Acorus calamus]|uniref:Chromo domain-containing protein n=1 Tax=Acorus calamus TaxID=4465 RepID=A0AAV9DFX2_ACOCL|nr:hypothetical protein QJS10_CPB14g01342 [Acorus calamus]
MERMDYRRKFVIKWRGKLVPKAFKYVQNLVKDIGEYIVRRSDDHREEVVGPDISYAFAVGPMPSRDEWTKVDLPFTVCPPKTVRPRGRPKKNRIRNPDEKKKRRHLEMKGLEEVEELIEGEEEEGQQHLAWVVLDLVKEAVWVVTNQWVLMLKEAT